jgi:hypothetical protein
VSGVGYFGGSVQVSKSSNPPDAGKLLIIQEAAVTFSTISTLSTRFFVESARSIEIQDVKERGWTAWRWHVRPSQQYE